MLLTFRCPPTYMSFVLVDDAGNLLNKVSKMFML